MTIYVDEWSKNIARSAIVHLFENNYHKNPQGPMKYTVSQPSTTALTFFK